MACYDFNYYYNIAKKYYISNGNLNIPVSYSIDNVLIGRWVLSIIKDYQLGKLSPLQVSLMEQIGVSWDKEVLKENKKSDPFDDKFLLAKEYFLEHGDLLVPQNYMVDGKNLGSFITRCRTLHNLGTLPSIKEEKLNSIGMIWDVRKLKSDNYIKMNLEKYEYARRYFLEHGNLLVPINYVVDGVSLGAWIGQLRNLYNNRELSERTINSLNSIGMIWKVNKVYNDEDSFMSKFILLKEYLLTYGMDFSITDNKFYKIKSFVNNITTSYIKNELSDDKINLLRSIGFDFESALENKDYKNLKDDEDLENTSKRTLCRVNK